MQVPEKLSLIGGSILLASTLVFTLKSQASNILPKVDSGVSSLVNADKSGQSSSNSSQSQQPSQQDQQKQQQAQEAQAFNNNFQQAQQKGWPTGHWGTAKFCVDDQGNMHVGGGQLSGPVENLFSTNWFQNNIKAINLDEEVQAPQDSTDLFGAEGGNDNDSTTAINGLDHLDTSQVNSMYNMFAFNHSLNGLDLSHFDTSNVNDMRDMFGNDGSLSNLDLSHFDTHNVNDMANMFISNSSLSNLDLSHFDTHNVTNMYAMFEGANVHQLNLGSNTKLQNNPNNNNNYDTYLSGTYQSNGQTLNLDGNAHPGTWIKQ